MPFEVLQQVLSHFFFFGSVFHSFRVDCLFTWVIISTALSSLHPRWLQSSEVEFILKVQASPVFFREQITRLPLPLRSRRALCEQTLFWRKSEESSDRSTFSWGILPDRWTLS